MPKNFSCNLGSINLSEFVKNPYTKNAKFDYEDFKRATRIGIRALDAIIDENLDRHALKEQAENSKNYRNVGLGTFGFANALLELGITYGSQEAKDFTDELFKLMFRTALKESNSLAVERGMFPKCKPNKIAQATIIKNLGDEKLIESIKRFGLRNCSLLSIAPNGSIGTMMQCSGGVEPEFALLYTRHTVNLNDSYKVYCKSVNEYCEVNHTTADNLPSYFVSSADINWKDRIDMQGVMQKWIDTAISSTINLAEEVTKEEIEQIYLYAWEQKLKGITVFRSGCKRVAILDTKTDEEVQVEQAQTNTIDLPRGSIIECCDDVIGKKRKIMTGCGSLHVNAYFDPNDGSLQEIYLSKGSTGGCQNFMIGLSRMISLACRAGVDIYSIKDQLDSTGACPSYAVRSATKHDTSKGACCPMAIGNALIDMYHEMQASIDGDEDIPEPYIPVTPASERQVKAPLNKEKHEYCPECGAEIQHSNGCLSCASCGWSKCN